MNYTSIEQSKKLLELGLSPESADCMWEQHNTESPYITVKPHTTLGRSIGAHAIPCWSVGALIALLPLGTTIHSHFTSVGVAYEIYTEKERFERLSLFEALYDIIEWLLKQGCIKQ